MRRQRCWIDRPRVWNQFEHLPQKTLSEILPPEFAQVSIPKERKQKLFFKNGFWRRGDSDFADAPLLKQRGCGRNVWNIEQLEETIGCLPCPCAGKSAIDDVKTAAKLGR